MTKHFYVSTDMEDSWSDDDRQLAIMCAHLISAHAESLSIIGPVQLHHILSGIVSTWITTMLRAAGEDGLRASLEAMLRDLPEMASTQQAEDRVH
jgi:hypothetical protein